jgi:hypothetical protein
VEQVALLAQQNTLPEPTLDLSMLSYSAALPRSLPAVAYGNSHAGATTQSGVGSTSGGGASAGPPVSVAPPPPDDPWMTGATRAPFGAPGLNGGT